MPGDRKFKILVTSFEPFDSDDANVSELVANKLVDTKDVEFIKLNLPLDYKKAKEMIDEAVKKNKPDYVISMGEWPDNDKFFVDISQSGIAFSGKEDRNNYNPCVEERDPTKPAKITAISKPLNDYLRKFAPGCAGGSELRNSSYGGEYMCNYAYYCSLEAMKEQGKKGMACFFHLGTNSNIRDCDEKESQRQYDQGMQNYADFVRDAGEFIAHNSSHKHFVEYKELTYEQYNMELIKKSGLELKLENDALKKRSDSLRVEFEKMHHRDGVFESNGVIMYDGDVIQIRQKGNLSRNN